MSWLKIYVAGLVVTPVFVGFYYRWEAFYDSILAGQPPNLTAAVLALVPGTDPVPRRRRLRVGTAFGALMAGWGWPLYWSKFISTDYLRQRQPGQWPVEQRDRLMDLLGSPVMG